MNILVLGSSHISCIALSYYESLCQINYKNTYTFKSIMDFKSNSRIVEPEDGDFKEYAIIDDLKSYLLSIDFDAVALSISGSDYLPLCISNSVVPYDFLLNQYDCINHDVLLVPHSEIRMLLTHKIRHILLGIREIRRVLPDVHLFYLEPPPPIEDNNFILQNPTWEKDLVDAHGISDPFLRLKFSKLHNELIEEECISNNIIFLNLPPAAKTTDGFMNPMFYGFDLMHANKEYGYLYLNSMESYHEQYKFL